MSHFLVYVVGGDVDYQLAPFSENIDEIEYLTEFQEEINHKDIEDKYQFLLKENTQFRNWIKKDRADLSHQQILQDFYGYMKNEYNDLGYYYNPNAFWDWYVVGGRWDKQLLLKDGSYVNEARKGDIDVHRMIADNCDRLYEVWHKVRRAMGSIKGYKSYKQIYEETKDYDKTRELYNAQPQVKRVRSKDKFKWIDLDDYELPRKKFIEKHKFDSFVPFGMVRDGEYYSNGDMGWFGIANNEQEGWNDIFMGLWHEIKDDELITAVDCHI